MLRTRIITALALGLVLVWALVALPPPAKIGCIGLVMAVGAWEWAAFAGLNGLAGRTLYALIVLIAAALAWRYARGAEEWPYVMTFAAVWWLIAFLWVSFWPQAVNRYVAAVAGLLVLVPAWFALARLLQSPGQGTAFVLFMLALVWAADVGAYFAGRRLGSRKLAPVVSPNKTWEGVAGGMISGLIVAVCGVFFFKVEAGPFLAVCVVVLAVSIVGDLTESMFKRYAGLKDSGRLLPGHGGILDRIDSVTAASPFFLLGLRALGVLS